MHECLKGVIGRILWSGGSMEGWMSKRVANGRRGVQSID